MPPTTPRRPPWQTRNKKDYTDLYHRFVPVVKQHLRCASCILDGECLVWNTRTQRFKVWGGGRLKWESSSMGSGVQPAHPFPLFQGSNFK